MPHRAVSSVRKSLLTNTRAFVASAAWALAAVCGAQERPGDESALIDALMDYLGFSTEHREELLSGGLVYSGMDSLERLEEDVAAAGVVMLVRRRSASEVVAGFIDTEVFAQVHDLSRYDHLPLSELQADGAPVFREWHVGNRAPLSRLAERPASVLNVGADEARVIAATAARDGQRNGVTNGVRAVLAGRLAAYVANGISGVGDYVRANGARVLPAAEIRSGIEGMASFDAAFEGFFASLGSPVLLEDELAGTRRLYWVEKASEAAPIVALLDRSQRVTGDTGIAAEIHFYVSSAYNAMVTLIGALPHGELTLVFAINHTYTDLVTGFGSTLRRRIARHQVAAALAEHLDRVRQRLEPNGPSRR